MFAFHSSDLSAEIYVCDTVTQPWLDASSQCNPVETPVGFDLFGRFRADIKEAHDNNHDWSSHSMRVGWFFFNGSRSNYYFILKMQYISSTGKIRAYLGYHEGTGTPPDTTNNWMHNTYQETSYDDWVADPARGYLYLYRILQRDVTAEPPGYTGSQTICMCLNHFYRKTGVYHSNTSSQYPYGWVEYTTSWSSDIKIIDIDVNATLCCTNKESVHDCALNAGSRKGGEQFGQSVPLIMTDAEGSYDPDPEPPTPPGPPTPSDDPNDEGDPSKPEGGDGDHTPEYDPIPIPNKPTQGAATAGFITMYRLTDAEMQFFAQDMFSNNIWTALRNYFNNPMDFLVGINLLPFNPHVGGRYKPKFGAGNVFANSYSMVDQQYIDIDCGYVQVSKYWGSCFDFEPYTKIQIWLPYIGYRDLPVDEIMDMTLSVKYRCDCLTGDCVAFIYTGVVGETGPQIERVIAQFYGNCAVRIPYGSVSYDAAISNSISLIGAAASVGLSAGVGTAAAKKSMESLTLGQMVITDSGVQSSAIGVVQGMKPNVHKGGAAGASTGYMSIQKPYLVKRIPRQNLPSNYMNIKGYPSNIGGKLADFTGLAIVDEIQLNDIPAMEDERKEIMQWLAGGVLI